MAEHVNSTDTYLTGNDDVRIYFTEDQVDKSEEKGCVLIVHGLGEHSGRYGHVVERLNSIGFSVFRYDHRGHGKSDGKRGHIVSFTDYIDDLKTVIEKIRSLDDQAGKFFLLGHSMGGLIVLNYAMNYPGDMDGVIASSPALGPAKKIPVIKGSLGKIMSGLIPSLSFDNELDPSLLSHDTAVVQAYIDDPLVHRRITARWFTEFLSAMEETMVSASRISKPILMQVAGSDQIVSPQASKEFFESLAVSDKTLHFYDDLYHEIYNEKEPDRGRVLSDLETWLKNHI